MMMKAVQGILKRRHSSSSRHINQRKSCVDKKKEKET